MDNMFGIKNRVENNIIINEEDIDGRIKKNGLVDDKRKRIRHRHRSLMLSGGFERSRMSSALSTVEMMIIVLSTALLLHSHSAVVLGFVPLFQYHPTTSHYSFHFNNKEVKMTATSSDKGVDNKMNRKGKPRYKSKFKKNNAVIRNNNNNNINNNDEKNAHNSKNIMDMSNNNNSSDDNSNNRNEKKEVTNQNIGSAKELDEKRRRKNQKVTTSTIGGWRTREELSRSESRLSKARALLEDFVSYDPMDESAMTMDQPQDTTIPTETKSSTTTVPDTVWYNTNLISKDNSNIDNNNSSNNNNNNNNNNDNNNNMKAGDTKYVTRWAKGVKVAEPLIKYDPVKAEQSLFSQPTKWLVRNLQIAAPLSYYVAAVVCDILTGQELVNRPKRAKQLLITLSGLGPAIIKGGQALASRSDLLPSEYLEQLQKLQDDVPRYANDLAFRTVEEELGVDKFTDVFELVEPEPIAAASIGQVYKARLVSNPDIVVALKIQRPNCESVIALDLYVLRWWSGAFNVLLQALGRDIDLQSIIDDFGELIYRELDYVAEAANAQRFNELYAAKVKDIFVPKVYSELTTSKVLTMEWVDGYRLTDNENLLKYGLDRQKLVDTLVQCSLRQILETGLIHVDPHAGNLLACPDGRLCYLDFGMISYADVRQRNGFLLAVVHIVNRDWEELVRLYQRLGFIPEETDLQPIEVALENALPDVLNSAVSELNFKNVVNKLGDIMYTYPFSLPPFYISIIRCLGVLEGLAIQVDPQARIISKAYPYVANRVLTDPQDELQEALRRLALTNDGHIRWSRLEGLLAKAKTSQGYDVTVALDQLTNYLISDDGEPLLNDFADQIVEAADALGAETTEYLLEASKALVINDEVAALKAFRSLQKIIDSNYNSTTLDGAETNNNDNDDVLEDLAELLPEPTPSMKQFWSIATLLGARGMDTTSDTDPSKFIPLIRKLAQEPKMQRISSEVVARLGERILSRSLRAAFGLPPPTFQTETNNNKKTTTTAPSSTPANRT